MRLKVKRRRLYGLYIILLWFKDIKDMNIENCITTYISSNENFLDIDNPDIDKIIDIFISLEVNFININYSTANKDLLGKVYKKRPLWIKLYNDRVNIGENI